MGPNAILGLAREGYPKFSFNMNDVANYLTFPGFWSAMAHNIRPGILELRNSLWRRSYLAACQAYCPGLMLADLQPEPAGIRAQAIMRDGSFVHDFLIQETKRSLHVCNAPSPAATSALPIADMIVQSVSARRRALRGRTMQAGSKSARR